MSMTAVARRVARADFQYVFGRFWTVRAVYGGARRILETFAAGKPITAARKALSSTLFPTANVTQIVQAVRQDAIYVGLNLPAETVEEIKQFALSSRCTRSTIPTAQPFATPTSRTALQPTAGRCLSAASSIQRAVPRCRPSSTTRLSARSSKPMLAMSPAGS